MDSNGSYSFDENALQQFAGSVPENDPGFQDFPDGPSDPLYAFPAFNQNAMQQAAADAGLQDFADGPLDPLFGFPGFSQSAMHQNAPNTGSQSLPDGFWNPALGVPGFDQNNLQPTAPDTGFFTHPANPHNATQQPTADSFALNGSGVVFGNAGSLAQSMSGTTPGLDNWHSDQSAYQASYHPYSFSQMTLPQSAVTDMFAPNALGPTPAYNVPYSVNPGSTTCQDFDVSLPLDESVTPSAAQSQSMSLSDPPFITCDRPGCTSAEVFPNLATRSQHIFAIHIRDVLNTSNICTWPGCTKSNLDTNKKLETHVTNIHIDPLLCTVTGCKRMAPFGRKGELDRHKASVHQQGRTWKCPRKDCKKHARRFPRKDKLREHIGLSGHSAFPCKYQHCSSKKWSKYITEAELGKHYKHDHGVFECGIQNCTGTISAFNDDRFKIHLWNEHHWRAQGLELWKGSEIIFDQMVEGSSDNAYTFTERDFEGNEVWKDCRECEEVSQSTAS
ncbi:hypothetical protein LSUE1_G003334 [Lachnellula suecica]|uniref:C2H2-type domain-containing protein n=1 Tax=Lachnellula suecica TaxID=602035 RepID=A0A8T9CMN6_9HELO|nr:hypothetical protein LSUE1_G003334 [Lachnellula suecica]